MDLFALIIFITIVITITSFFCWCCKRKQKGIVFSRPGDNVANPYDPNYGQTNAYPTQQIVQNQHMTPQQAIAFMEPPPNTAGTTTIYPVNSVPYPTGHPNQYLPPNTTGNITPYPVTSAPYPTQPMIGAVGVPPYPTTVMPVMPTAMPPSSNSPYPSVPEYHHPTHVPVGTAPKLPTYQEATATNELYSKQEPYNPNF